MFAKKIYSGKLDKLSENVDELIIDIKEIQSLILGMSCDLNNFKHALKKNNRRELLDDNKLRSIMKEISGSREASGSKETKNVIDTKMMIIDRVRYYLTTVDYLKTIEVLELLNKESINISSKNPARYVSNILSNSILFYYSDGWRLNPDFIVKKREDVTNYI